PAIGAPLRQRTTPAARQIARPSTGNSRIRNPPAAPSVRPANQLSLGLKRAFWGSGASAALSLIHARPSEGLAKGTLEVGVGELEAESSELRGRHASRSEEQRRLAAE